MKEIDNNMFMNMYLLILFRCGPIYLLNPMQYFASMNLYQAFGSVKI